RHLNGCSPKPAAAFWVSVRRSTSGVALCQGAGDGFIDSNTVVKRPYSRIVRVSQHGTPGSSVNGEDRVGRGAFAARRGTNPLFAGVGRRAVSIGNARSAADGTGSAQLSREAYAIMTATRNKTECDRSRECAAFYVDHHHSPVVNSQ